MQLNTFPSFTDRSAYISGYETPYFALARATRTAIHCVVKAVRAAEPRTYLRTEKRHVTVNVSSRRNHQSQELYPSLSSRSWLYSPLIKLLLKTLLLNQQCAPIRIRNRQCLRPHARSSRKSRTASMCSGYSPHTATRCINFQLHPLINKSKIRFKFTHNVKTARGLSALHSSFWTRQCWHGIPCMGSGQTVA
jgi:hypothetical protein